MHVFHLIIFRPSPEEAKQWEHDFMGLLQNKYGLNVFQEFLRTQYGDENLNFWMAVEEYKHIPDKNARNEMARMIYEDYVSTLSPTEVKISYVPNEICMLYTTIVFGTTLKIYQRADIFLARDYTK